MVGRNITSWKFVNFAFAHCEKRNIDVFGVSSSISLSNIDSIISGGHVVALISRLNCNVIAFSRLHCVNWCLERDCDWAKCIWSASHEDEISHGKSQWKEIVIFCCWIFLKDKSLNTYVPLDTFYVGILFKSLK